MSASHFSTLSVISGNAQKVQMMSDPPRQADMIVQDWQVRCRCADSQKISSGI
jgi:hypothetical protein